MESLEIIATTFDFVQKWTDSHCNALSTGIIWSGWIFSKANLAAEFSISWTTQLHIEYIITIKPGEY